MVQTYTRGTLALLATTTAVSGFTHGMIPHSYTRAPHHHHHHTHTTMQRRGGGRVQMSLGHAEHSDNAATSVRGVTSSPSSAAGSGRSSAAHIMPLSAATLAPPPTTTTVKRDTEAHTPPTEAHTPTDLHTHTRVYEAAEEDAWVQRLDHEAFKKDVAELGRRLEKDQGQADVDHLKKMCLWSNLCGVLGLATMWMSVNPFTVFALSLWTFSRWTIIAHHTGHGGYNRADKTKFFNSRGFAQGSLFKRATQWFDWMLPEAWNIEHNNLHHYRLGERDDPDLVERNLEYVRQLKIPKGVKYVLSLVMMSTWKWFYYAPNTYKELKIQERKKMGLPVTEDMQPSEAFTLKAFMDDALPESPDKMFMWYSSKDLMKKVLGPYLLGHFILMPLPALLISPHAYANAVISLLLAEVVTNIHSFIVIGTNHAGSDVYKFSSGCSPNSATFFMRQVIGSVNFRTGGDLNDFMHGWLNYQIEHHVWPSLSALSYQRGQPELKRICEKHGVPYVQESVWVRLRKTVDIMVGNADQRPFPEELERKQDLKVWTYEDTAQRSARLGQDVKVAAIGANAAST